VYYVTSHPVREKEKPEMPVISTRDNLRLSNEEANNLTRECLCTAMMRLMSSTPFDRITIADIVELAGVSRMAFYRNYRTKEALAKSVTHQIICSLVKDFSDGFEVTDKRPWYVHFFETMLNNKDYLRIILSEYAPIDVSLIVNELFPSVPKEEHYFYIGRGGALLHILKEWYNSGLRENPEEMADLCNQFFSVFR
jgi:AcrR family transcriptional regulator